MTPLWAPPWAALLLAAASTSLGLGAGAGEGECPAGDASCGARGVAAAAARQHPWPYARGPAGSYGVTSQRAPRNLSASLAWSWHDPRGRFGTVLNGGILIDDGLNLYTASVSGIHKLSPDGRLLWTRPGEYSGAPVLVGDTLYGDSKDGLMFALDLETGSPKWGQKVAEAGGSDCHSVGVSEGVMVTSTNGNPTGGNKEIRALNATTGNILWTFKPESQLWNFMPMFTGNGSVLFQDQVGGAYHLNLTSGKVIWHTGVRAGFEEYWTDGMSWLGPNGLFYAAHVHGTAVSMNATTPSHLRAYRVSDGEAVWRRDFPYPINSQPVVATLREGESPSLVMCSGVQAALPLMIGVVFGTVAGLLLGALMAAVGLVTRLCSRESLSRRACLRLAALPPGTALLLAGVFVLLLDSAFRRKGGMPSEVQVLDAATGDLRWHYAFPVWSGWAVRGDEEGVLPRLWHGSQPFCVPNGWGSPSVDASGTVWLGHQNGLIYGLRDENGDGRISEAEVSTFDMGASSTHFGGAFAGGMMAWASCDTVFVFRE